jgi:hypothetical protein
MQRKNEYSHAHGLADGTRDEDIMTTMIVKLAAAMTCVGLACPGIANAQPLPGIPDIPEIDETFAFNYALDHQREDL